MNYCLRAKVENCTLWLRFPRDKSTSHFSHLGLSKLLSVGLFTPLPARCLPISF